MTSQRYFTGSRYNPILQKNLSKDPRDRYHRSHYYFSFWPGILSHLFSTLSFLAEIGGRSQQITFWHEAA